MYGQVTTYGRRLNLSWLKIRKGFIPLFMSRGLKKDLSKRGMLS